MVFGTGNPKILGNWTLWAIHQISKASGWRVQEPQGTIHHVVLMSNPAAHQLQPPAKRPKRAWQGSVNYHLLGKPRLHIPSQGEDKLQEYTQTSPSAYRARKNSRSQPQVLSGARRRQAAPQGMFATGLPQEASAV